MGLGIPEIAPTTPSVLHVVPAGSTLGKCHYGEFRQPNVIMAIRTSGRFFLAGKLKVNVGITAWWRNGWEETVAQVNSQELELVQSWQTAACRALRSLLGAASQS